METTELRLVLENCVSPAKLRSLMSGKLWNGDPYEAAARAVLNGEPSGEAIAELLDSESRRQRAKIASMTIPDLRASLSPESVEPGPAAGAMIWSLMRDGRLGAQSLAREIASRLMEPEPTAEPAEAETDAAAETGGEDIDLDEIDLDELLLDLSGEESEPEPEGFAPGGAAAGGKGEPDYESEPEYESEPADCLATPHIGGDPYLDTGMDAEPVPVREPAPAFEADPGSGASGGDQTRVSLGGVSISLSSLKRACEKVFGEPVELVADEYLTREEKVVVVGKECGVKVLNGPNCVIRKSAPPLEDDGSPIRVSPSSVRAALERVFGDEVELIPDAELLGRGVIAFAGRKTGIDVIENPRLQVPVPDWSDASQSGVRPSFAPEDERLQGMSESLSALEARIAELERGAGESNPSGSNHFEAPQPSFETASAGADAAEGGLSGVPIELDGLESGELEPLSEFDDDFGEDEEGRAVEESGGEDNMYGLARTMMDRDFEDETENVSESPDTGVLGPDVPEEPSGILDSNEPGDAIEAFDEAAGAEDEESGPDTGAAGIPETETPAAEKPPEAESVQDGIEEDELDLGDLEDLDLEDLDLDGLGLEESGEEDDETPASGAETGTADTEEDEDEFDLDGIDLDALADEIAKAGEEDEEDVGGAPAGSEKGETSGETGEDDDFELDLDDLDLDLDLDGLEEDEENGFEPRKVLNGEMVLLLGGEEKSQADYGRAVEELGGRAEFHAQLDDDAGGGIDDMVDRADIIMTLTADAIADPGILRATTKAREANKRLFNHHSANPVSIQKRIIKLVEEGKV